MTLDGVRHYIPEKHIYIVQELRPWRKAFGTATIKTEYPRISVRKISLMVYGILQIMRIFFIADGRSPTALRWLRYWIETGHSVHLVSTFPCSPPKGIESFHVLPVAFGRMAGGQVKRNSGKSRRSWMAGLHDILLPLRYFLGPLTLIFYRKRFKVLLNEIQPELVHALRIPYEGMLASAIPGEVPLIISIWGNDLTLHAHGSFFMKRLTLRALRRADGLIADTQRDISLGQEWGFSRAKPTLVVPGSGGIRLKEISLSSGIEKLPEELPDGPIIVNPRGQRPGSLRQDVFFHAIPLVLARVPEAFFICPALQGDIEAEKWVDALGIRSRTKLWPYLDQAQLWYLFQKSRIFVSPSVHDGTPNSFLEAMACGCFPIVGNIESMREWIQTGVNGFLVDASDAHSIADAVVQTIKQPTLQLNAAKINAALVEKRAEFTSNMESVEFFYNAIKSRK